MRRVFLSILLSILSLFWVGGFNTALALAKAFIVEKSGSDKILISDGFSQYVIEHDYNCYSSDFYDGMTFYIDTFYSPGWGDTIIIPGYFSKTCNVTNSTQVNIKRYYVDKVIDSNDKIIVTDNYGTQYLVEYGLGCGLSMWRYEGKTIDIDIGGAFLDGIRDRIYLFDSGRDCKVWDADELSSGGSSFGSAPDINEFLKSVCPANSQYFNGQCVCNDGYVASGNTCITYTQNCQNKYGANSYGDKQHCYCSSGYEFNSDKTACVKSIVCPANSTKVGQNCLCNEGFILRNGQCITYTQDCRLTFGDHVIGRKGDAGNSFCDCESGYTWNSNQTNCIKIEVKSIPPAQQPSKKAEDEAISSETTENNQSLSIIQEETTEKETNANTIKESTKHIPKQEKQNFFARIFESIKKFFIGLFK
jgi:hypothetical protein